MKDESSSVPRGGLWQLLLVATGLLMVGSIIVACSSYTSGMTTPGAATVKVTLSDPATCSAPDGPYSNVWVTVTDVQANVSSTAGDTDSGWVDLTPSLASAPKQVDLLSLASNQCLLVTLGDNQELQAGTYQQIRIMLAADSTAITSNNCSNGSANCVVLSADSSFHTLNLSSEAQTGLKIPSGQIAGGGFTIAAGQTKDLNIDFNTCMSIVQEGNGQFRLKPVLHAGEVSTTSSSLNGKVLDAVTGNVVAGTVEVALEQPDSGGIDRVVMSTTAAADGTFVFCPLPAGTYDLVIVGAATGGILYEPAIVTGVSMGDAVGTVKLQLPMSATAVATTANLNGQVTSQSNPTTGIAIDVTLSALEKVGSTLYTIPLPITSTQSAATLMVETAVPSATLMCPTNTYCANYSLGVPTGGAFTGAWSAAGTTLTQSAALATYEVDAMAASTSSSAPDCSMSDQQSAAVTVASGAGPFNVPVPVLNFTTCQ